MSRDGTDSGGAALTLNEPFLGTTLIRVARLAGTTNVRIAISIERSWDVDILVPAGDAATLAESLGATQPSVVRGESVDGEPVVLTARGDRLGIIVLEERIGAVLVLGDEVAAIQGLLQTAALGSAQADDG